MPTNSPSGYIKKLFSAFMRYRNGMLAFIEGLENDRPDANQGALRIIIGGIIIMVIAAVILGCVVVIQAE